MGMSGYRGSRPFLGSRSDDFVSLACSTGRFQTGVPDVAPACEQPPQKRVLSPKWSFFTPPEVA